MSKDRRFLDLLSVIVDHNAPHNVPGKGVPIGNLTGQHFTNLYLDQLGQFVKEETRDQRYVRLYLGRWWDWPGESCVSSV